VKRANDSKEVKYWSCVESNLKDKTEAFKLRKRLTIKQEFRKMNSLPVSPTRLSSVNSLQEKEILPVIGENAFCDEEDSKSGNTEQKEHTKRSINNVVDGSST
jgi:hypothetical protein